jgi:hypothetical protein
MAIDVARYWRMRAENGMAVREITRRLSDVAGSPGCDSDPALCELVVQLKRVVKTI